MSRRKPRITTRPSQSRDGKPDGAKYDQILGDCLAVNKYGNDDDYTNTILYDYEDWICSTARKFESLWQEDVRLSDFRIQPWPPWFRMYGHAGRTAVRDDLCRCVHVSLPGNGQKRTLRPL